MMPLSGDPGLQGEDLSNYFPHLHPQPLSLLLPLHPHSASSPRVLKKAVRWYKNCYVKHQELGPFPLGIRIDYILYKVRPLTPHPPCLFICH